MSWQTAFNEWLNDDTLDKKSRMELLNMSNDEIADAFHGNLEFGTAGMRGLLGVGTNRMNIYTIRKANEGFARYIEKQGKTAMNRGVVIAYDSRHMSRDFAEESACMMAGHGIKTYLFTDLRPTPELSFAVRHLKAFAGIVITASHNPKQYNGYKIYNDTGCQAVPAEVSHVIAEVASITNERELKSGDLDTFIKSGLIKMINEEVDEPYNNALVATSFAKVPKNKISVVYTSLHGTGYIPVKRALETLGYQHIHYVEEQCKPDPDFTTVSSPNPENEPVFDLAKKLGKAVNADILLATDPDADRLGVGIKTTQGNYELLDGNTTGALMTYYILERLQEQKKLPKDGVVFTTIVTSDFAEKIAADYQIPVERTLTGFKYIGDCIRHYEKTGEKQFIYGFEESYGSLVNAQIARDKDAVQAVLILTEMAAYYQTQGKTLLDVLNALSQKYGYFVEDLKNIELKGIEGSAKIQALLSAVADNPFSQMNGQNVSIFENYQNQTRYFSNGKTEKIALPVADVLKFYLADDSWFVLRPSGTEPKAKVYVAVKDETKESANENLQKLSEAIMQEVNQSLAQG